VSSALNGEAVDVVIVGSGATGSFMAKELAAAGLRVLVLEAGRSRARARAVDFAFRAKRKLGHRIAESAKAVARQPIQSRSYAWSGHPHAFVDDLDHPYEQAPGKPYIWFRSRQVGGRMMIRQHGKQFYRMSRDDFHAGSYDGRSDDWPLSYEELEPFYEQVERKLLIAGNRDQVASLPDSIYDEAQPLLPEQQRIADALEAGVPGARIVVKRTTYKGDFDLLPGHDGRLSLRTDAIVAKVDFDPVAQRVRGVTYIDAQSGKRHQARAKLVILCASAIESARLLLNSATPEYPEGLGNTSGVLGRYLMDHVYLGPIVGRTKAGSQTEHPTFLYMPQFMNRTVPTSEFVRGYAMQIWALGDECHVVPLGEMLPRADNRVTIDPGKRDRHGLPVARIECAHGDNEHALMRHARAQCVAMLQAAGYDQIDPIPDVAPPGFALHEGGTARMGSNPKTSFLNPYCQSWEIPNLFVADGSCWVSHGVQNVTLTMLALAARTADYIVRQHKHGAAAT